MYLLSPPGVYRAQGDTAVMAGVLARTGHAAGRDVLDLGTGSGALALAAARAGAASVTAVDLSRRSVAATWLNTRMHGARVSVRRGDLYRPVDGRRFGLIVANPPYVPAETATLPRYGIARCWDAGLDGRTLLDRICDGAESHLTDDGRLLVIHSAVCGAEATVQRLARHGLVAEVVDRARIPFGPVMRARAAMLEARGLIEPGETEEDLVVIGARRAG
ncbi:MAG: methyltransferase [Pseudonocardia sp.]|nr:methyltransferase [Pseudonocardia sp.]